MTSDRRQTKLVNVKFQRAIALRIVAHSILFAWTVFLIILGCVGVAGLVEDVESLAHIRTICLTAIGVSTVVVLPAIAYDSIKFSHRMAGPILRMKNTLPSIGLETLEHVGLRKDDFWQDLAAEFNDMLDRVEALRQAAATTQAGSDPNRSQNPVAHLPAAAGPTFLPLIDNPALPVPSTNPHVEI